MKKIIFHIDMDAFFSAIEELVNPHLKGKPVIVCGDPLRRSVVSTASYEARKYGLRSGMPIGEARRLYPVMSIASSGMNVSVATRAACPGAT